LNREWFLLKVNPGDLSIINTYKSNPSDWDDIISIGVNPVDNEIWLVGIMSGSFGVGGRVGILSRDLTLITSANFNSVCHHITFDELGYAYIICGSETLKMSSNLDIVTRKNIDILPSYGKKILYSNGYLYLVASKRFGFVGPEVDRHVVMRLSKDLDVVDELVLSMQIEEDSYFTSCGGNGFS